MPSHGTDRFSVVLSIGYGRLHLMTSAEELAKHGYSLMLVCGWVPSNPSGKLVRFCSKVIGRDLSYGLQKRAIRIHGVRTVSLARADFIDQFLRLVDRKFFRDRFHGYVSAMGWRYFGRATRSVLKKSRARIFHVRSGAGQGGAILLAKHLGMKVVVDHSIAHPAWMDAHLKAEYERNGTRFDLGMESPFWRMIVRDCEEADCVLVNSEFVKETFVANGFASAKIRVVYLGVRPDFIGLRRARNMADEPSSPLKLLFTGGFGFRKGGVCLLGALKLLKDRNVPFVMDVVGDYSSAQKLVEEFSAEQLPVVFHGQKPQDELKSFLSDSDVYVFPSLAEGCAQSGMEALAAGLCVVATRESGLPIQDGKNGYLIEAKNPVCLADRLEWLSTHHSDIDRVGTAASCMIAHKYTWEQYAKNTHRVYEDLLEDKA